MARRLVSTFAVLATTSLAAPVMAGPVPAAAFFEFASGAVSISTPGAVSFSTCTPMIDCTSNSASASSGLVLKAMGSAGPGLATSGSTVTVFYDVVGPSTPNVFVPVDFSGTLSTTATGGGGVSADINGGFFDDSCGSSFGTAPTCSLAVSHQYDLAPNVVLSLTLSVQGLVPNIVPGTYTGFADPLISIDPAFAAANPDYRLLISPNVAPEPAGWVMMLLGAGATGALLRRHRRAALG